MLKSSPKMPPASNPLHDTLDADHVMEAWNNPLKLSTYKEAKMRAVRSIKDSKGLIRSINLLVLRANDDMELIRVGARGGTKTLWNFGKVSG